MRFTLPGSYVETCYRFAVITESPIALHRFDLEGERRYRLLDVLFHVGQIVILCCAEDDEEAAFGRTVGELCDPHKLNYQFEAFDTLPEAVRYAEHLWEVITWEDIHDIKWGLEMQYLKASDVQWDQVIREQRFDELVCCIWCFGLRLPFSLEWRHDNVKEADLPPSIRDKFFMEQSICPGCIAEQLEIERERERAERLRRAKKLCRVS